MNAFEAWLEHLFDRPPSDFGPWPWYYRDEDTTEWTVYYEESDSEVAQAERILRLFSDAGTLLRPYSDEQVGHGLNVIVSPAVSGDIRVLAADEVPPDLRTAGLRSIVTLFAEVFAPRLSVAHPRYGNSWQRSEPRQPVHPLDFICYMFWDICPLVPGRDDTTLEVLEATLALDSEACQRAALHGLGHAHLDARDKVAEIIYRWLQRHPHAPDELRAYAVQASTGRVL